MKRLFSILFCLALLGCQKQEDTSAPKDLLSQEKMVQILADVHLMESLIETHVSYPDTAIMVYNKEHKKILEKHGVTNIQFQKSYNYYGENLEQMDKLYEVILDTLSAREAKVTAKAGGNPTAPDSLDNKARRSRRLKEGKIKPMEEIMRHAPQDM